MILKEILLQKAEEMMGQLVAPPDSAPNDERWHAQGYKDGLVVAIDVINGFPPTDITCDEALARIDDMVRAGWKVTDNPATHEEGFGNGRHEAADDVSKIIKKLEQGESKILVEKELEEVAEDLRREKKRALRDMQVVEYKRGYAAGYKEGMDKVLEIVEDAPAGVLLHKLLKRIRDAEWEDREYTSEEYLNGRADGWASATTLGAGYLQIEVFESKRKEEAKDVRER